MNPRFITLIAAGSLLTNTGPAGAAVFSELPVADAFVRASVPTGNYGASGSLAVSGTEATNSGGTKNGAFEAFIQFSTATSFSIFNTEFGAGLWRISAASLKLTGVASPGNAIFNNSPGNFSIRWINRDDWQEGAGRPTSPGFTGINWNQASTLTTAGTDEALGQFYSQGGDAVLNLNLALPSAFTADLKSGGLVSFQFAAVDSTIGFNFRSRDFLGESSLFPNLILTAEAIPEPTGSALILLAGSLCFHRRHRLDPTLP